MTHYPELTWSSWPKCDIKHAQSSFTSTILNKLPEVLIFCTVINFAIICSGQVISCYCCSTHLLSLVLTGLEYMDQPLQLVSRVSRVHHQPEVFSSTEVHVERHHPETRPHLRCVESSISKKNNKLHTDKSWSESERLQVSPPPPL